MISPDKLQLEWLVGSYERLKGENASLRIEVDRLHAYICHRPRRISFTPPKPKTVWETGLTGDRYTYQTTAYDFLTGNMTVILDCGGVGTIAVDALYFQDNFKECTDTN